MAAIALAIVPMMSAQTTMQAQLVLRTVNRDDIATFKLPSTTELNSGLSTIGVGQPFNLEAQIDINVPPSEIASVTWTLDSKPAKSNATFTDSPFPSGTPPYEPSDRLVYQVAGRTVLRPDVPGIYNVTATVTTSGHGVVTLSKMLTASTYMGVGACSLCHSNGPSNTPWSMVTPGRKRCTQKSSPTISMALMDPAIALPAWDATQWATTRIRPR